MFGDRSPLQIEQDIAYFVRSNEEAFPEEHRSKFMDLLSLYGVQRHPEALERLLAGVVEIDDFPETAKPLLGEIAHLLGKMGWNGKRERGLEIEAWLVSILDQTQGNELPAPAVDSAYTFVRPEPPEMTSPMAG